MCGAIVTANLVLTSDMTCAQDALIVGADNVTIDLGGHTILGVSSAATVGVMDPLVSPQETVHSFALKHGTIAGFGTGVSAVAFDNNTDHATINGVHLIDHVGVQLGGVSGNIITNDTFEPPSGDTLATGIETGQRNGSGFDRFSNNTFKSLSTAIDLFQWGNMTIDHNTFTGNRVALSTEKATGVTFASNDIEGGWVGDSYGVFLGDASDDITVTGNTIENMLIGVDMIGSGFGVDAIAVSNNIVSGNGASGIVLIGNNSGTVTIQGNTASGNGFNPGDATNSPIGTAALIDGIYINVTPGSTTLRANHSNNNAGHGIQVSGTVVDGGGNTASGNVGSPQCVGVACS